MIKRNPKIIKRNIEIWKPIPNWPNYEISNMGRVASCGIIRKLGTSGGRYLRVDLHNGPKRKDYLIHLLVIKHFGKPKPSSKHECNHIDGIKSNNWNINLEWLTHQENIQHAYDTGLYSNKRWCGETVNTAKLTKEKVLLIRKLYENNTYSITELSLIYRVTYNNIVAIIQHKTWKNI